MMILWSKAWLMKMQDIQCRIFSGMSHLDLSAVFFQINFKKIGACWIPYLLIPVKNRAGCKSIRSVAMFLYRPRLFKHQDPRRHTEVVIEETWLYIYESDNKENNTARCQMVTYGTLKCSIRSVMYALFFDSNGTEAKVSALWSSVTGSYYKDNVLSA